jgi:hypothetical protein
MLQSQEWGEGSKASWGTKFKEALTIMIRGLQVLKLKVNVSLKFVLLSQPPNVLILIKLLNNLEFQNWVFNPSA